MAEGFARKLGKDIIIPYSAGIKPNDKIDQKAIDVMKDIGIDISKQKPKSIDEIDLPELVISMDSENQCNRPGITCIDWGLANPDGKDDAFYKRVRNIIASRMRVLIDDLHNE